MLDAALAAPQDLFVFVEVCEFLGGVGLIVPAMTGVKPKLTPCADFGLALVMILAAVFHIVRGESRSSSTLQEIVQLVEFLPGLLEA